MASPAAGTAFQREVWIGKKHVYHAVPPFVKEQCSKELEIPPEFLPLLHPHAVTVSMVLKAANIPEIGITTPIVDTEKLFLRGNACVINPDMLLRGPLLPIVLVRRLSVLARQAWLDGQLLIDPRILQGSAKQQKKQVQMQAAANLLPLWVPRFWLALHPIAEAKTCWKRVTPWLSAVVGRQEPGQSIASAVEAIREALCMLPHSSKLAYPKKAWEGCKAGDYNLSQVLGRDVRELVRKTKTTDPEFWAELTGAQVVDRGEETNACEDADSEDVDQDDPAIPTLRLVDHLLGSANDDETLTTSKNGALLLQTGAESEHVDDVFASEDDAQEGECIMQETQEEQASEVDGESSGRPKRTGKSKPRGWYTALNQWQVL